MNKVDFLAKVNELSEELFEDYEIEDNKIVSKEVKSLKEQLAESITKNSEKDAEIERLKAAHIKVVNNGAPLPVGEQEDPFVSLFKNIIK